MNTQVLKRTYQENPFLSIVTRCMNPNPRPISTQIHEKSIDNQTDKDIEHIYVQDNVRCGLFQANRNLALAAPHIKGKYVHINDDDDYYTNMDFVKDMKAIAERHDPDIIIFKGFIDLNSSYGKIYPCPFVWGKRPEPATIGSFCFIIKSELWKEYIKYFGTKNMGDYNMVNRLFDRHEEGLGLKEYWHDQMQVATYQVGRGGKYNK